MKRILIVVAVLTSISSSGQALYQALEFKKAYENGTRLPNGDVSPTYWQNRASYDIVAKVEPATRQVTASATIWYYNESPDTLTSLVFHAYKDLYKKGSPNLKNSNDEYVEGETYSDGMVIKTLTVAGKPIDLANKKQITHRETNYRVYLSKPLMRGDSVSLEIAWSITIPAQVDRDGAYDASSMLVAYWYPEIAVYDDVFGWDNIVFDGSAEFYHDMADFKVEIEIPNEYLLWASSEPLNLKDILSPVLYSRWEKANKSTEKVVIVSEKDLKGFQTKSNRWKFEAKGFRDFSFAFSDHYIWEACSYTDDKGTYLLNSAYPASNPSFSLVLAIEQEAIRSFHTDFPVYPFPFKHFVAFNGEVRGSGMEFAGMINDAERSNYKAEGVPYSDYEANKLLTFHEMMHMYFPFLMGINEKRFAWMEEGMAEFSEDYFTGINLESTRSRARFGRSTITPMMVQTYIDINSGINSYDIASQSYYALLHLLGKEKFTACLNGYMDRWKNKHPTPYDYFYSFNDLSGQELNWFWKAWYFDWGFPDLAINLGENGKLKIENVGGRPLAFSINTTYADGTTKSEMVSPIVWKSATLYEHPIGEKKVKRIELKTLNGADAVLTNNILEL